MNAISTVVLSGANTRDRKATIAASVDSSLGTIIHGVLNVKNIKPIKVVLLFKNTT